MLKLLSLFSYFILLILPSALLACPNLKGQYWCVVNDGHREAKLDVLTIDQWQDEVTPSITYFNSRYRSIPDGDETFSADSSGIPDRWGWITKCTVERVVSVRNDFSALSELYLDKSDNLVRSFNQKIEQVCSRKAY